MVNQVLNAEQTFVDLNGDPLSGGFVYMYVPNTSNFSTTWSDSAGTIVNTNPIVLDQAGRASIWGVGSYRQVVTDQFGTVQWDRITTSGASMTVPGQVVGDLSVTGNGVINGSLAVGGGLNVTGGEVINSGGLTNNGGMVVNGHLDVNQVLNSNAGLSATPASGGIDAITASGDISVSDGPTGHGDTVIISSSNSPCFSVFNTAASPIAYGMWCAAEFLNFGTCGGDGRPNTVLMRIDSAGNVSPLPTGVSMGLSAFPWLNVVAHNFITVSTQAESDLLADGQLAIVEKVPVKTLPHIGVADADAIAGGVVGAAQEGGGMSYNVLVGVLWKALQELKGEFDTYVAAHP
jgi:hypothetical protein